MASRSPTNGGYDVRLAAHLTIAVVIVGLRFDSPSTAAPLTAPFTLGGQRRQTEQRARQKSRYSTPAGRIRKQSPGQRIEPFLVHHRILYHSAPTGTHCTPAGNVPGLAMSRVRVRDELVGVRIPDRAGVRYESPYLRLQTCPTYRQSVRRSRFFWPIATVRVGYTMNSLDTCGSVTSRVPAFSQATRSHSTGCPSASTTRSPSTKYSAIAEPSLPHHGIADFAAHGWPRSRRRQGRSTRSLGVGAPSIGPPSPPRPRTLYGFLR